MRRFLLTVLFVTASQTSFGQLTGEGYPGENLTVYNRGSETIRSAGLDLKSKTGIFVVAEDASPAPFQFFISRIPNQVTVGSLGSSVSFEPLSSTEMEIGLSGNAIPFSGDITATWGDSITPVAFPVRIVPEPAAGLMAAFGFIGLLGLRRRR